MQADMRWTIFLMVIIGLLGCQENFDMRLERETSDFTRKHCPQRKDGYTTLDSMTYQSADRTIVFWYSLDNLENSGLSDRELVKQETVLRDYLIQGLRADTKWRHCMDKNINFKYVYNATDRSSPLISILLTKEDYL